MSLTDDWKAGTLEFGFYYVKTELGNVAIDCFNYDRPHYDGFEYIVKEIIQPVPSYDELASLETRLEMAQVQNAELIETNASLSSQIKHLLDLQKDKDKKVENLRELLKECKNIVVHDLWSRAQFPDGQVVEKNDILTHINAAIGESEE